ncbi:MAG TPA: response regulator [Flavobacterium sp.]|jgi:two-component system response regulator|nr:response regulator [Flavobacterium sp.]
MDPHYTAHVQVLLVEDNIDDAELTIRALKKNKIVTHLHHVKDGAEALDFIFATGSYDGRDITIRPSVVLLDINMPKIGGREVLRRLKEDERTKAIPVVILTSSKENPDVESCYQLGANSYIIKPVGYDNFMAAIKDLGMYWMVLNHQ